MTYNNMNESKRHNVNGKKLSETMYLLSHIYTVQNR